MLKAILEHSVSKHPSEVLKYKKLILCETSGKRDYRTINYEQIPLNMFQRGETLDTTEEGVFVHENKQTTSPAFDSPDNKWSRQTNTPKPSLKTSLFGHTITCELSNLSIYDDRIEISSNVEHDDDYGYIFTFPV